MQKESLKMIKMSEEEHYSLRGQRVTPRSETDIAIVARALCSVLDIRPSIVKKMDSFIENLREHGINVEVAQINEWVEVANAVCDPNTGTIMIPNHLYGKICKKDVNSIFILFHEIGHIILGHKALLHHQDIPCTQQEDSEWQADTFSEYILRNLKLIKPIQLILKFE